MGQSSNLDKSDRQVTKWDGSPLTRASWYFSLEDELPLTDKKYTTLIERGYTLDKNGAVVVKDDRHLVIVRDGVDTTEYSFEKPSPVDPYEALTTAQKLVVDAAVLTGIPCTARPNTFPCWPRYPGHHR